MRKMLWEIVWSRAVKHSQEWYKKSIIFESLTQNNANEEAYVIENFFQSLVVGVIPVVIGAPNIQNFAPTPNSILHIRTEEEISSTVRS